MEVYVDDMVVKSEMFEQHLDDLAEIFSQLRLYNMRLNPTKCVFGVEGRKFLGFMLTHRGIEANPDKCEAISSMRSPVNLKELQRLVGRLTSLSRFLPRMSEKIPPIIKILKKADRFKWDDRCEDAFNEIKATVSSTSILEKSRVGSRLLLYLSISEDAVSSALVQEEAFKLVYFTGQTLHDAETRYQLIKKAAIALVYTARRLRPYFQGHPIIIKTDYPIGKVLLRPDLAGRMIAWSTELSEFDLLFEPRGPIRAQCLADFVAELQVPCNELPTDKKDLWKLYVDDSSNQKGCGAGVVLESPTGVRLEQSLRFTFKASKNQAEYEALIADLLLAIDMGVEHLVCLSDSQLTVGQVNDRYQVKDPLLTAYYQKVLTLLARFKVIKIEHILKSSNSRADTLSKLALGKGKGHYDSVILLTLNNPSVSLSEESTDGRVEVKTTNDMTVMTVESKPENDWRQPIKKAIISMTNEEPVKDKALAKRAARYVIIGEDLYKRGFLAPLLKCLYQEQAEYVMNELHNGVCGMHYGQRTLAARVIRAGYYWPTIRQDCSEYMKKCQSCQKNGPLIHQPSVELHCVQSPWPFAQWGMDIVGPFPPASGQRKFLIVAIDYFTKWIEAEPVAKITAANVQAFTWKVICRVGIPHTIITNNSRQFVDRKLELFLKELGIKHVTSSVEHPQTNG